MSDEKSRGATSAHRASAKPGGPAGRSWAAGGAGAAGVPPAPKKTLSRPAKTLK